MVGCQVYSCLLDNLPIKFCLKALMCVNVYNILCEFPWSKIAIMCSRPYLSVQMNLIPWSYLMVFTMSL